MTLAAWRPAFCAAACSLRCVISSIHLTAPGIRVECIQVEWWRWLILIERALGPVGERVRRPSCRATFTVSYTSLHEQKINCGMEALLQATTFGMGAPAGAYQATPR